MEEFVSRIAERLATNAEAVCRRYLSAGRREGRYWLVGDIHNTPGRSLYVRLTASADGLGRAGKWCDAQNGDHGDLLDLIAASCGHRALGETLDEARHFLKSPALPRARTVASRSRSRPPAGTAQAALRLWATATPIAGSMAASYLAARGITDLNGCGALRFHARCRYRPGTEDRRGVRSVWPAMIAAVTDLDGVVTGVHRTWLDIILRDKAPIACPRRAMGPSLGRGVRFGDAGPIMVAGEGIETTLSLRQAAPRLPAIAGLSAGHLGALRFSPGLKRLYVARDDDAAGTRALVRLTERAGRAGIEIVPLKPRLDDFNSDLRQFGLAALARSLQAQFHADDAARFLKGC